jgi:hypothetical protein
MANPLTIVTTLGALLFGIWWFTGGGCKGDGNLVGPNSPLCFDASVLGINMGGGGDEPTADEVEQADLETEEEGPGAGPDEDPEAATQKAGEIAAREFREKYPGGIHPATPSKANLASYYASYVGNNITVA